MWDEAGEESKAGVSGMWIGPEKKESEARDGDLLPAAMQSRT